MKSLKCEALALVGAMLLTRFAYSTGKDELLETAMALHEAALKDEYFIKRRLAPNVDFWCVMIHTFVVTHEFTDWFAGGKTALNFLPLSTRI
jgi:citrate synthase